MAAEGGSCEQQVKAFLRQAKDRREWAAKRNKTRFQPGQTLIVCDRDKPSEFNEVEGQGYKLVKIPVLSEGLLNKLDLALRSKQVHSSDDEGIYPELKAKDLLAEKTQVEDEKDEFDLMFEEAQHMSLDQLFKDDNKYSKPQPEQKTMFDYDKDMKQKQQQQNLRAQKVKEAYKQQMKGGHTDYDDGIKMQDLTMGKKAQAILDASDFDERVLEAFKNEDLRKKDEEEAKLERKSFAFGGLSVKDKVKKKREEKRLDKDTQKVERLISEKHK